MHIVLTGSITDRGLLRAIRRVPHWNNRGVLNFKYVDISFATFLTFDRERIHVKIIHSYFLLLT